MAKMNVMDYSLVIGIDEENGNLILGIIGTFDIECSNDRFHPDVYLGQKTRELGKGTWICRGLHQGADYCDSAAI